MTYCVFQRKKVILQNLLAFQLYNESEQQQKVKNKIKKQQKKTRKHIKVVHMTCIVVLVSIIVFINIVY